MESRQLSLFETEEIHIDKHIRLIELFGGYGSQAMAFENIGADFETYRLVEFDKYAVMSYNAAHGTNFEPQDITKICGADLGIVDTDKYCYVMTYSFPCQDLSVAGNQKGMAKGSGTRSGLLWEVERLLNETEHLPQILVMENVTQVHGEKNLENFYSWIDFLRSKGYSGFYQDMNAKNYGVAQNRDRCFMVSILGDYEYYFPTEIKLEKKMKDYLEDEVDEKFYLKSSQEFFIKHSLECEKKGSGFRFMPHVKKNAKIARTITAFGGVRMDDNFVIDADTDLDKITFDSKVLCNTNPSGRGMGGNVYIGNLAPTLTCNKGECIKIAIKEEKFTKQAQQVLDNNRCEVGDTVDAFNQRVNKSGVSPTITTRPEGFKTAILPVVEDKTLPLNPHEDGCCRTIKSQYYKTGKANFESQSTYGASGAMKGLKIRKLTPRECGRLMGVKDVTISKMEKVNSNSQLYKQFGNSIVVPVLEAIFRNMNIKGVKTWSEIQEASTSENGNPNRLFNIYGEDKGTGFAGNVWDKEAISPTLTTMEGGGRQPMILEGEMQNA